MGLDEVRDVGHDLGCFSREAALGGGRDGAAPAALVEGVYCEGAGGGEEGEEVLVAVQVVGVAVEEEDLGCWGGGGLGGLDGMEGEGRGEVQARILCTALCRRAFSSSLLLWWP